MRVLGPEKGNAEIAESLKELSYLKYGRRREEVEREIMQKYGSEPQDGPSQQSLKTRGGFLNDNV